MRTTIRVDESLLREARQVAARTGKSLTAIIEDALRESLARQHRAYSHDPVHLITFAGSGLRPGVDLDNSASLFGVMDATDKPNDPD